MVGSHEGPQKVLLHKLVKVRLGLSYKTNVVLWLHLYFHTDSYLVNLTIVHGFTGPLIGYEALNHSLIAFVPGCSLLQRHTHGDYRTNL